MATAAGPVEQPSPSLLPSNCREHVVVAETPAKRVKLAHETVTPCNCCPTPSPSAMMSQDAHSPYSLATPMSKDQIRELLLEEANYDCEGEEKTPKRSKYLSWDDYFMSIAFLSAMRSKDPATPAGACIVDEEYRVIGIGYNGFPRGCSDNVLPWILPEGNETHWLHTPNPYMCHAEVNAILNKCSDTVAGARMYVRHFPCNECAKVIVQSRIREVVYMVDRDHDSETFRASRILLTMAGVKMRQYEPTLSSVQLDLASFLENGLNESVSCATVDVPSAADADERSQFRELLLKEATLDLAITPNTKRTNYLSWDDYFTAVAFLTAKRSKDPNTQVGACIVDKNKCIVGLGYNGFPRGCSDDYLPWARGGGESKLHTKYPFVCHAEVNAILNKCSANVKGATLYVALFPCNECAKMIIQAGIREVVYTSDKYHDLDLTRASRILFQMAGVKLRQHIPSEKLVDINFGSNKQQMEDT